MLRWITLLILVVLLISCSEKEKEADWTILVYMAADNGLNADALADIEEMMLGQFSDDVNVIVQIDESELSDDPTAKRYKILPGTKTLISNLGEIDSGYYNNLTKFANWAFDKYPAEKKALFIWGHGNGWYNAYNKFCPDNDSNSAISVPDEEFKMAMQNINFHLDILVLDACNMLTMEVITEIFPYTDYIMGSEAAICPDGSPYDEFLTMWEDYESVDALVQQMAVNFVNSYMPQGSQNPNSIPYEIALGVVKTANFDDLVIALYDFVEDWLAASFDVFAQSRDECAVVFNDLQADVDIYDYFSIVKSTAQNDDLINSCTDILDLLDEIFIYDYYIDLHNPNGTQNYPAGRASIWFPTTQDTYDDLLTEYQKLDFSATGWQLFIGNYFRK
ncbi:MAG: hypothetical protein K9N09_01845 [Candidatus Cloacimonetes bacterium]|nr:hypothetical protein [Candidatus Cloacimonadota bacterium]MCF7813217.1 hypothetical protein [Candidatus Cloacimonadota bacterium]MCF7867416.1 hypothetical protein [Candidatus Cloacimonadota bacterium]MCF7882952.1 hypothetical protein [Candidatus Cloacimonadota bacterium]